MSWKQHWLYNSLAKKKIYPGKYQFRTCLVTSFGNDSWFLEALLEISNYTPWLFLWGNQFWELRQVLRLTKINSINTWFSWQTSGGSVGSSTPEEGRQLMPIPSYCGWCECDSSLSIAHTFHFMESPLGLGSIQETSLYMVKHKTTSLS